MPWNWASTARPYVPTLFATSPFGRDAVGTDDDCIDLTRSHEAGRHHVGDEPERNTEPRELPGGQPRALQHWSRLADPHGRLAALLVRAAMTPIAVP